MTFFEEVMDYQPDKHGAYFVDRLTPKEIIFILESVKTYIMQMWVKTLIDKKSESFQELKKRKF